MNETEALWNINITALEVFLWGEQTIVVYVLYFSKPTVQGPFMVGSQRMLENVCPPFFTLANLIEPLLCAKSCEI